MARVDLLHPNLKNSATSVPEINAVQTWTSMHGSFQQPVDVKLNF